MIKNKKSANFIFLLFWLIIVFLYYFLTTKGLFFSRDDLSLLENVKHFKISWLFTPSNQHLNFIFKFFYYLCFKLFHLKYSLFRAVLIFIHLVNIFILYKIVQKLTKSGFFALLAALFFGISYVYSQTLLWIFGYQVLLKSLFVGFGFWLFLLYEEKQKVKLLLLSLIFLFLAGLTSGDGLAYPFLFGFIFLIKSLIDKKFFWPEILICFLLQLVLSFIYFSLAPPSFLSRIHLSSLPQIIAFFFLGVTKAVIFNFFSPNIIVRDNFSLFIALIIAFFVFIFLLIFLFLALTNPSSRLKKVVFLRIAVLLNIIIAYLLIAPTRYYAGLGRAVTSSKYTYTSLFFFVIFLTIIFSKNTLLTKKRFKKLTFVFYICFAFYIIINHSIAFSHQAQLEYPKSQRDIQFVEDLLKKKNYDHLLLDSKIKPEMFSLYRQEYTVRQIISIFGN